MTFYHLKSYRFTISNDLQPIYNSLIGSSSEDARNNNLETGIFAAASGRSSNRFDIKKKKTKKKNYFK